MFVWKKIKKSSLCGAVLGQWAGLGGPAAGAAGGDHQEPGGLLHEDRHQNLPRPRAQDHHVPHDQRRQELHQQRAARQPLCNRGHGEFIFFL